MKQKNVVKVIPLILVVCFFLSACTSNDKKATVDSSSTNQAEQHHLLIAAAASLESVMENQLIPAFEKEHSNTKIEGNYDSSGKLQTQIEKGLEADIFFSAATKQMDALVSKKLIDEKSVDPLLKNQLVMIIPSTSTVEWNDFSELKKAEMIAIGDPESVPAGQYAEKGLNALGYWDYVKEHASFGTNVTEVLNWVAQGSAQAGLVYATDAASTDKVKVVAVLPEDTLNEPIIYPVGVLERSEEKVMAEEFMTFFKSKEAANYFEDAGFILNK
ncbi:molybdate ABC transporter, periplasmic molybdate-binding protein [Enterococcus moraviensis ATCC BAA-383]|uniref:Molybdate ABC transporter, periplasmic molybdate-binding protein n=1 Tax=Enterococcus moraviensis ATCC BAA-383 TaxID=1158609 RepID=R2TR76_9ENTE|nr:molybdate ABC transporter substrate-binding protein [Enterococcus moraviensis]EOI02687.1 molybdate ABC transporter, periplasmic molybdate-binding protein [Enterococcus moraviensis ATCC BAA-383]EOT73936.1 molybdate ABC transporter, periplasmic molybdate-binding protein [Enterococcus moraviensis ATCC BAA-383]OJG66151.1 molybdate ABC transporter, periplasmic molybdate-binding protein [Enterococcus moraviensis]